MRMVCLKLACWLGCCAVSSAGEDVAALLEKVRLQATNDLNALGQCVCQQSVERLLRPNAASAWKKLDTLNLDVALVEGEELYGKAGGRAFYQMSLADSVGKGMTSTGRFGLLLRQVVNQTSTAYKYNGVGERNSREAHEIDFEVLADKSNYRLRAGAKDASVAYQGTIWVDVKSLELIRLEAQAFDIPHELDLVESKFAVDYARMPVGDESVLLPAAVRVEMISKDGQESMNRSRIASCRRYTAESSVVADGQELKQEITPPVETRPVSGLPAGSLLEVVFDESVDLQRAAPGQPVKARLSKPLRNGDEILLPEGSLVLGEIVAVERQTSPLPVVEIGLSLSSVETNGKTRPLIATMVEAEKAKGLLREKKELMPQFTKKRADRMDILVRKVEQGQGFLQWDSRQSTIPRGFKTTWRINDY